MSKQDVSGESTAGGEKSKCNGPEVKSCMVGEESKEVNETWEEWVRDQALNEDTELTEETERLGPCGLL